MRRHRRWLVALLVIAAAAGVVIWQETTKSSGPQFANAPYSPQRDRNSEWAGQLKSTLTDTAVKNIADNDSLYLIPKYASQFNIKSHFAEATRVHDQAEADGNPIKIFEYFNASYWVSANDQAWQPWSKTFSQDWYMKTSTGTPIAYYGYARSKSAEQGSKPVGYMMDLSNPDLRAWAVNTISDWMKQAPYSGIVFDAANELVPESANASVQQGATASVTDGQSENYNELFCGTNADCPRVAAWNQGLFDLIQQTAAALHKMGKTVIYNGIAPSQLRVDGRNLNPLKYADAATNESFCFAPSANAKDKVKFTSFTDDAKIVQMAAGENKSIIEIVDYQIPQKKVYGDYCFGGFMMGWQPGHSYFMFHTNYSDPVNGQYPIVPEQNLNFGDPTGSYQQKGDLLTRSFQNGYVAVNQGTGATTISSPGNYVQFENGQAVATYHTGDQIKMAGQSSVLMLSSKYLYGTTD